MPWKISTEFDGFGCDEFAETWEQVLFLLRQEPTGKVIEIKIERQAEEPSEN